MEMEEKMKGLEFLGLKDTIYKEKKPFKVYIAGKLDDNACNYIKNVHNMVKDAEEVRKSGFSVFVPGIDLICGLINGDWNYKDYFDNSQPWLDVSDAVYVRGKDWNKSNGTLREIKRAEKKDIPIFFKEKNGLEKMITYFKINDIEEWAKERGYWTHSIIR